MQRKIRADFPEANVDGQASALEWLRAEPLRAGAFLATVAVCLFYDAYRYPLRINDASVSPTYADTPFSLQAAKYLLLGVVVLALLAGLRSIRPRQNQLLLFLCIWAFVRCALGALSAADASSLDVIAPFVIGAVIAVMLQRRVPGSMAYLLAAAMVLIHAVANVAQVLLYLGTGRLPALAYAGDAIKRFGGLWDDPNSVGVVSALFLVYLLVARRRDYWVAAAAAFNVLVSVSYSAVLALAVGACAILIIGRSRLIFVAVPLLVGAAVALLVLPMDSIPVAGTWLETKQSSATERLTLTTSAPLPDNLIVGDSLPKGTENSIAAILGATGLVGLAAFLAWIVVAWRSTQRAHPWAIPILAGFFAAALVVPFVTTFPVGTLFPLFLVQVAWPPDASSPGDAGPSP